MSTFDIFSLPQLAQDEIFAHMDVHELITLSLSDPDFFNSISCCKKAEIPQLEVVVSWEDGRFKSTISLVNEHGNIDAEWVIIWKNGKRPRRMSTIGQDPVLSRFEYLFGTARTTMQTTNPIRVTSALLDHFQVIYRSKIDLRLKFVNVDMGDQYLYKWKFLSKASQIAFVDSRIDDYLMQDFQKMIRPHQELHIEGGSIEFKDQIFIEKLVINGSPYFNFESFPLYSCSHLEIPEYGLSTIDAVGFLLQWVHGQHSNLKSFTMESVDVHWIIECFEAKQWNREKRFWKNDAQLIETSEGYDFINHNGIRGTIVFGNHQKFMKFLVWP